LAFSSLKVSAVLFDMTREPCDVVVAVMGVTGSGKTSFIKGVTGIETISVAHGLDSGSAPPGLVEYNYANACF
jgi:ABC-type polar amino acid transport system ATPase subunit